MATEFLRAEWRKLVMAQYAVPPNLLEPYLPAGLEFDLWQGRCYVSLVGFLFDRVRVKGILIPWHTRFEEVNLRFYVKQSGPDGSTKRGVVFINEFVPRWAIAFVAKAFYEEPYRAMPMCHVITRGKDNLQVQYGWRLGGHWYSVAATADPASHPILSGSEEEFITEHYWGYTKRSNGLTSAYRVEHPRWQVYPVRTCAIEADFGVLYGRRFGFLNDLRPDSVLLAEGAPVQVFSGERLPAPTSV